MHYGLLFPCDQCEHVSTRLSNLKKHKLSKHDKVKHSCDHCSFSSSGAYYLRVHIKTKHADIGISCQECDFVAFDESSLKKHKKTHVKVVSPTSSFGVKPRSKIVKITKIVRRQRKKYPCDSCEFSSTRVETLKRHKACDHGLTSEERDKIFKRLKVGENINYSGNDDDINDEKDFDPLEYIETFEDCEDSTRPADDSERYDVKSREIHPDVRYIKGEIEEDIEQPEETYVEDCFKIEIEDYVGYYD